MLIPQARKPAQWFKKENAQAPNEHQVECQASSSVSTSHSRPKAPDDQLMRTIKIRAMTYETHAVNFNFSFAV